MQESGKRSCRGAQPATLEATTPFLLAGALVAGAFYAGCSTSGAGQSEGGATDAGNATDAYAFDAAGAETGGNDVAESGPPNDGGRIPAADAATDAAGIATGDTYYVSVTGSDSNPGTSASPFRTITHAYSVVMAGDTILVEPGTYTDYTTGWGLYLSKSGTAGAPITLRSVTRGAAIIDGSGITDPGTRPACVYLYGTSYNTVDGFMIRNCLAGGISIFANGSQGSAYNVFVNNEIYGISNPSPTHTGDGGQGIYDDQYSHDNYFGQNYVHDVGASADNKYDHGMYMCGSNETYVNNLLVHNEYGSGLQLAAYGNVSGVNVYDNTIANNADYGIVIWSDSATDAFSDITVANNITYGNAQGIAGCGPVGTNITLSHNLSFGNSTNNYVQDACGGGTATFAVSNLIQQSPLFVNAASNFQLQMGSPALGAGVVTNPPVTTDFAGNPRGSPPSIGAYEQ
jgi:hypothetical protein